MAGKTANRETLTPHVLHMTVLLLSLVTFSGVIVIHVNWSKAEMVMGNVSTLMSAEALDTDLNPPLSNGPLDTTGNFFTAAPSTTAAPTSLVPRVSATAAAVPVESTPQPTTVVPARWTTVEAPPADTRVTTLESTTVFATLTSAPETEPAATAAPLNETATSSSKRAVPVSHGDAVVNTRARPPLPPTATEEAQFIFLEPTKDPVKIEPPAPLKGHRIWVEVEPAPSTLDLEDGDAVSAHVSEQVGRIVADMSHDIFMGRDPFSNTTTGPRPAVDLQSPYFNAPGLGNIIVNQGLGNLADAPKHVYPAGNEILDAVITHVDHNAPGWADLMRKFLRPGQPADLARFRDLGELQYCISGILHHGGSFIRNVHVIVASESHVPAWLARLRETERSLHERIRIVTHDQIFPKDCSDGSQTCYLPTFSSCAIEATMHRIPGLSPYFIYFNNDMFFGRRLSLYDYFRPVLAATPVDMNKVSQDNDFPMPLKANALHKAFVAAKSMNQRAMAWLQGRFAVGERTSAFGVNMVTGQGLGLTGEDAPRRFFVEFEPLVFSERKDLPNGCSPYKEDQGVKDGALVCREKNPNFARQHALKNAKLRHARCPHITNSSRDPEIPNFKKNDGPRSSRSLLMPGPCYFATAEEYELASALYVTLWKKLKSAESQSNTSTRTDAEVDDIIREARAEARTIRGLKPMPGGHMGHSVRTGRFLGLKAPVKDDQYDFNIFYTVNKRRGWDYFGVFPTHTFAHAPRVMDQGGLVDMLNLLHPLTVSTRSHRFRESIDLFVPYLWELYAIADRRHRRERMQASRAMLLPGDAESIMPTTAPASLRVDICHRNVSLQRRVVFSPAVMPIDYRQWRVNCADTENDLVAQLRPLGPILPTNLLQASINMPSRPPNAFGVTWTQGSTNYATEKLISEFFVMNLKPMYYFAMVANRFEVKKYKAELARQVTAFITVNDNFRNVDALTLTTIQEMFRVVIGDAPLLGLD